MILTSASLIGYLYGENLKRKSYTFKGIRGELYISSKRNEISYGHVLLAGMDLLQWQKRQKSSKIKFFLFCIPIV